MFLNIFCCQSEYLFLELFYFRVQIKVGYIVERNKRLNAALLHFHRQPLLLFVRVTGLLIVHEQYYDER
jgi:hypothetical protein